MFNVTPDKLPEKYASTICCDVCTDDPNKSCHVCILVSDDTLCIALAFQFGFANLYDFDNAAANTKATLSIYAGLSSSTTQHLKFISNISFYLRNKDINMRSNNRFRSSDQWHAYFLKM